MSKAQKNTVILRGLSYKLLELQQKYQLFKPGMVVVDLGAAPGGWYVVAKELVGQKGVVIAVNLLPISPLAGVEFIQGDFNEQQVFTQLQQKVVERTPNGWVDLVISDMAPKYFRYEEH